MKKFFLKCGQIISAVVLFCAAAWTVGAAVWVWELSPLEVWLLSAALGVIWISGFLFRRAHWLLLVVWLSALSSFLLMSPEKSFSGKWRPECSRIAAVKHLPDGRIKLGNVRNFHYRKVADFDMAYREMVLDPEALESMEVAFSHWDGWEAVAHMLLCFNFRGGEKLAVSFEPRVPEGLNGGDFFLGIYRRYAQMMLFGSPEDLFELRVKHRGESLYRYRCRTDKELLKRIFLRIVRQAEQLEKRPAFYNSITDNCTTALLDAMNAEPALRSRDIRQLLNGYYDRYLYEKDFLVRRSGESFCSLKTRSYVAELPENGTRKN